MNDVKQTYQFNFAFNKKDIKKQLNDIAKDVKIQIEEIGQASDKVAIFKNVVSYIDNLDKALNTFKKDHKDDFDSLFGNIDNSLTSEIEKVFGILKDQMSAFSTIRDKISGAWNNKADLAELREIATEINSLYSAIGAKEPINIDELFTGKGSKSKGTDFASRIKILDDTLNGFAINFQSVQEKLKAGLTFGGVGGASGTGSIESGINDIVEGVQDGVDALDKITKVATEKVKAFYDALIDGASDNRLDSIKQSLKRALSFDDKDFMGLIDVFGDLEDGLIEEDEAVQKIIDATMEIQKAKNNLNNVIGGNSATTEMSIEDVSERVAQEIDNSVDAIEYGKTKIVNAWKDYYHAVEKAKASGANMELGETSYEMDKIKYEIDELMDKWNVGSTKGKHAKFELDLSEYIADGDLGLDQIGAEIDRIFREIGVTLDISTEEMLADLNKLRTDSSTLGDVLEDEIEEVASEITRVEDKTNDVHNTFQALINYISQSGKSPKAFFTDLWAGAQKVDGEIKNILESLNLLNTDGSANFSSISSGYTNKGGMISDDYVLIARSIDKMQYALEAQPKMQAATSMGANIGAILEVYKDEANGLVYELQKTVKGKPIIDFEKGIVNTDFLYATHDQVQKFIEDLLTLQKTGLYIDHGGSNILFDEQEGFSFIDLASASTWFTASEENSVKENLDKMFAQISKIDMGGVSQNYINSVHQLAKDMGAEIDISDDVVKSSERIQNASSTTTSTLHNEEIAHENNTDAIEAENKALQAQIELKKKAQSMTWESFALDESLTDLKQSYGIQTLGDAEKFWKKANYDKNIDFYEMSAQEADDVINDKMDYSLRQQWYTNEHFDAKNKIENAILANDELRNAAMNKLYHIYKKYVDSAMRFDDFLNSELTVYKGDSTPVIYGDEQKLSFSFREEIAQSFGSVQSAKIIPKQTVGSVATKSFENESEVFVDSALLPYLKDTHQTFQDYYSGLTQKQQQILDTALVQLETQRVENLLDPDVVSAFKQADQYSHLFKTSGIVDKFKQGIVPNLLDPVGDFMNGDDFVIAYNNMSDMQKKLTAYYASLRTQYDKMNTLYSSEHREIGKTDIIDTIVHDAAGAKEHVAGLTNESKFNIFGQGALVINQEAEAHKKNAQAIQSETQAQNALNSAKSNYIGDSTQYQADYNDALLELYDKQEAAFNELYKEKEDAIQDIISYVDQVESADAHATIDGAGNFTMSNGKTSSYQEIIWMVETFEQQYLENLALVKDYLKNTFEKYNMSLNSVPAVTDSTVAPITSQDVLDKVFGDILQSNDPEKDNELWNIYNAISGIANHSEKMLDLGEYVDGATGEIKSADELMVAVHNFESKYKENMDLVHDYLNQVFAKYNADNAEMFDLYAKTGLGDDDLDLGGFNINDYDNQQGEQAVVNAQKELGIEQEITAEKQKQALLDDADTVESVDYTSQAANIDKEIASLDELYAKVKEVEQAILDKNAAFIAEGNVVDSVVQNELSALVSLLEVINEIKTAVQNTKPDAFAGDVDAQKIVDDAKTNMNAANERVVDGGYALDTTLVTTNNILESILATITSGDSIAQLVAPLDKAITELKNVASGIVKHQKAQKTDLSAASTKIANNYGQLSSVASNAVTGMGDEVRIKGMQALADSVVRVEGAVRSADGVWSGFIVDVNESNQAVVRNTNSQSEFAKALNETAEAAKKATSDKQDEFTQSLLQQREEFTKYSDKLKDVDYLSDDLRDKLNALGVALNDVSDESKLASWVTSFKKVASEVTAVRLDFERLNTQHIGDEITKLHGAFKTLDNDQKIELQVDYEAAIMELEQYKTNVKDGKKVELDAIYAVTDAIHEKIAAYQQANKEAKKAQQDATKKNAKFGSTAEINATAKYNTLKSHATSDEFVNSAVVSKMFEEYEAAYNNLIAKRKELANIEGALTEDQKAGFKQLQTQCNDYAKALEKVITNSQKLKANSSATGLLGEDFDDSESGRRQALMDFVNAAHDGKTKVVKFKDACNQLIYTVDNGDGTFTQMTAAINDARTAIHATAGETQKASGMFGKFFSDLASKFKSIGTYFMASLSWQEIWQQIRKGITYVRDIDGALTELKKVTDATDAEYKQFLNTMSKSADAVGSTIKDLTSSAADWARLNI